MNSRYGKRPLWQWILVYVVIGGVIYAAVYFLFLNKGGYKYGSSNLYQANPTGSAQVAKNYIEISNFNFSPATLTVKVGDTVTWTNKDSMSHSATADDKSFDTGVLTKGQSGKVTFSKAGTYTYYCSIHSSMRGTIIVQ